MRRIVVAVCLVLLSSAPVAARMYQWQNPTTGTTQLAGTPPAWYRSPQGGPRVWVFDNNQLVDDTGIAVSDEQRAALQAEAFGRGAPQEPPAAQQAPPAAAPDDKAAPDSATQAATSAPAAPLVKLDSPTAGKAEALKALIDAWDQRQLDQARSLLEMVPSTAPPAPAKR